MFRTRYQIAEWSSWKLVGFIPRRSQVRILLPLPVFKFVRRDGRIGKCVRLESGSTERTRGIETLSLRQPDFKGAYSELCNELLIRKCKRALLFCYRIVDLGIYKDNFGELVKPSYDTSLLMRRGRKVARRSEACTLRQQSTPPWLRGQAPYL